MKIMSVDYGDARTGIAISDLLCSIVGSTTVIHSHNDDKTLAQIRILAKENSVGEIVVGLPKNMDGTEGFRAERVKAFCEMLQTLTTAKIETYDERLSTVEAYRMMDLTGTFGKKRKENSYGFACERNNQPFGCPFYVKRNNVFEHF